MFVVPLTLKGTPAVTTIWSVSVAKPYSRAAFAALTTAILKRSTGPSVCTQWTPQVRQSRLTVAMSGDSAMIGTAGRSRATRLAVVPDWLKQQIALMSVVSAISRAAATMPSAMLWRSIRREASMISR